MTQNAGTWTRDILGAPFETQYLRLKAGNEGPSRAALVRAFSQADLPAGFRLRPAVLYLHGFNDYFFQAHHAQAWLDHGYDFYALELRKQGRSLHPGEEYSPTYSLDVHFEELDLAFSLVRAGVPGRRVIGLGHSTGGLMMPLWLASRKTRGLDGMHALILNSAWLELQGGWLYRGPISALINILGRVFPTMPAEKPSQGNYVRSLHQKYGGEWDFSLELKLKNGPVPQVGWVRAIRQGQRQIGEGLDLEIPIAAFTSDRSDQIGPDSPPGIAHFDAVLALPAISWPIAKLGALAEHHVIPGGAHDLSVSALVARQQYEREIFEWLEHLPIT